MGDARKRGSFRRKLLLQSVVVGGTGVVLTALAIGIYEQRSERASLVADRVTQAEIVSSSLSSALVFDDADFARDVAKSLSIQKGFVQACVYDGEGRKFASFATDKRATCPDSPKVEQTFEDEHLQLSRAIVSPGGEHAGTLYIEAYLYELGERRRQFMLLAFVVALASLGIALILWQRLSRTLIRPIDALSSAADTVGREQRYDLRVEKYHDDELGRLTDAFNVMLQQISGRDSELRALNEGLEQQVAARTAALERSFEELQGVSYSISHDLRAPLRAISGYIGMLDEDFRALLPEDGQRYLNNVVESVERMAAMLDDMVDLLRLTGGELELQDVDLTAAASLIAADLKSHDPDRMVEIRVQQGLRAWAEPRFVSLVLHNLLGNAWKFTAERESALIEVGCEPGGETPEWFVRDNGVGFEMKHSKGLFRPFSSMHKKGRFPGTGMGLAIVERAIGRHGGKVRVDARVDDGATFWFSFGPSPDSRGQPNDGPGSPNAG